MIISKTVLIKQLILYTNIWLISGKIPYTSELASGKIPYTSELAPGKAPCIKQGKMKELLKNIVARTKTKKDRTRHTITGHHYDRLIFD